VPRDPEDICRAPRDLTPRSTAVCLKQLSAPTTVCPDKRLPRIIHPPQLAISYPGRDGPARWRFCRPQGSFLPIAGRRQNSFSRDYLANVWYVKFWERHANFWSEHNKTAADTWVSTAFESLWRVLILYAPPLRLGTKTSQGSKTNRGWTQMNADCICVDLREAAVTRACRSSTLSRWASFFVQGFLLRGSEFVRAGTARLAGEAGAQKNRGRHLSAGRGRTGSC
jgi:hypothetical protein